VILLGTRDARLRLATDIGCADVVVNVRREDPLKIVGDLTNGLGANVVFETAGSVTAQQQCFDYCRKEGTVVLLGLTGGRSVSIDVDNQIAFKELSVQASFLGCPGGYEGAVDIISSGHFPIEMIATHKFPLRDALEAMRVAREEHDQCLKVVVLPET
jgi:threonine dehydrogenase-like Zn-dependent dehydrogenase